MTDTQNPQPDEQPSGAVVEPGAPSPLEQAPVEQALAVPQQADRSAAQQTSPVYTASPLPETPAAEAGPAFHQPSAPSHPRRRGWIPALAAGGVLGLVLGAAAGAGAGYLVANGTGAGTLQGAAQGPSTITITDPSSVNNVAAVAASAMASVVTISVTGSSGAATGSGVVLDSDGHIVTNTHVVTIDGTTASPEIKVTTSSGRIYSATVVGMDPLMDIAVIQVTGAQGLVPIQFADSAKVNVGATTIAIGAPLGLSGTVTSGIVSALNRSIEVQSSAVPESGSGDGSGQQGDPNDPFNYFQFDSPGVPVQGQGGTGGTIQLAVIQTDTAINPGNSGGALLDADGRLIGVNEAIATASGSSSSSGGESGSIGIGFAIPSNTVKRIADEIIQTGAATHGLLGATVADASGSADATVTGALVKELSGGGAAEQAGLRVGDVITSVDGVPITGATDATAQIRTHAAGSKVEIGYDRGGKSYTVEATLGSLDAAQAK